MSVLHSVLMVPWWLVTASGGVLVCIPDALFEHQKRAIRARNGDSLTWRSRLITYPHSAIPLMITVHHSISYLRPSMGDSDSSHFLTAPPALAIPVHRIS